MLRNKSYIFISLVQYKISVRSLWVFTKTRLRLAKVNIHMYFISITYVSPGYYLYMESSAPAQAGGRAILKSPELTAPRGGQCMKFFYTMYGKTMGSLSVTLQQSGRPATTIFSKAGDQGVHWIGAQVSLDIPERAKYQVILVNNIMIKNKPPENCEN